MTSRAQNFINLLDEIKPSKHRVEIFSDWLVLASSALYSWKKDKDAEKEYKQIVKIYNASELEKLNRLLAETVEALEEKEQDFLGEIFTLGKLTNDRKAQFFTPFHISQFMAEISMGENKIEKGRLLRIGDPCCGSGGLLIACALVLKERGINYQKDAFFVGTDIDHRCARMAFIQLSLLGASALIICGNTLTSEVFWQRETIGYHISNMDYRLNIEKAIDLLTKPEIEKEE
jgi:type I restriction-modification system DNA methylase subunit